ncbi:MAG: hypothetical protein Q8N23_28380 [Archangium sp.]|nr:hypothetical protein [Archangium sp.]MDP3156622.1 hypothetical protein [Archangium sp.]MDP3576197.1 hypothetical protein [Archangium sp.]
MERTRIAFSMSRLLAILDGATQIEINDSEFIELDYPSDQATSLPIHFSGLPTDSGHRIDVIQLDSVDRFQFFPDGRASNWFSPLVADVGSAAW